MNERIRELCSQAISDVDGIQNPDTQNMYIPDCFAEKFAELILRDVHQYVDRLDTAQIISNGILRRYGLEEV